MHAGNAGCSATVLVPESWFRARFLAAGHQRLSVSQHRAGLLKSKLAEKSLLGEAFLTFRPEVEGGYNTVGSVVQTVPKVLEFKGPVLSVTSPSRHASLIAGVIARDYRPALTSGKKSSMSQSSGSPPVTALKTIF